MNPNKSTWSNNHALEIFEKPRKEPSIVFCTSNTTHQSFNIDSKASNVNANAFDLNAKAFVPSSPHAAFDPFEQSDLIPEEIDDDEQDLSQRFLSSNLLDEEDVITPSKKENDIKQQPKKWHTRKHNADIKDIWNTSKPKKEKPKTNNALYPSNARDSDEQEFDPTLQFFHGSLYDSYTVQDMHRLSLDVTNPSLEEAEAENVAEDMSALQIMQTIFSDLSEKELVETLERVDYDVDRAIESLLTDKAIAQPIRVTHPQQPPQAQLQDVPKKRQVCRHFLAGECYRKDCWFVHDLQEKVCKFWLQGKCLKGDSCEFSHTIDIQEVANKLSTTNEPETTDLPQKRYDQGDYPALSSKKVIPMQQQQQQEVVNDDFPSLASAATIKKSNGPMTKTINFAEAAKRKKPANSAAKPKSKTTLRYTPYKYSMHELTRPVHIPWLETGSSLNSVYMKEREQAIEYGMLRNRFFSKATEYYLKGDGARAKLFSMEAKHYNRLMQEMHTEASQRIFEQRSKHEAFIDLHGLHEDEAIDIIDKRLNHLRSTYSGIIYIVTGTGHHSGANGLSKKQSKLKPSVQSYLKHHHYRFAETSIVDDNQGGVFAVEI